MSNKFNKRSKQVKLQLPHLREINNTLLSFLWLTSHTLAHCSLVHHISQYVSSLIVAQSTLQSLVINARIARLKLMHKQNQSLEKFWHKKQKLSNMELLNLRVSKLRMQLASSKMVHVLISNSCPSLVVKAYQNKPMESLVSHQS